MTEEIECLTIAYGFPWISKYILLSIRSVVWNFKIPDALKDNTFLYIIIFSERLIKD